MQLTPIMYGLFAAITITLTACDQPQKLNKLLPLPGKPWEVPTISNT